MPAAAAAEARRAGLWASAAGGTKARRAAKAETANLVSRVKKKFKLGNPPYTELDQFLLFHQLRTPLNMKHAQYQYVSILMVTSYKWTVTI